MKISKLTVEIIPEYFAPGPLVPVLSICIECNGEVIQKREIIRDNDFVPLFEIMMNHATKEIIQQFKETTNASKIQKTEGKHDST